MNLEAILNKLVSYETISETNNKDIALFIINFLKTLTLKLKSLRAIKVDLTSIQESAQLKKVE